MSEEPALHARGHTGAFEQLRGLGLVAVGDLQVGRLGCPLAEQLDVELPDPSPDLEDASRRSIPRSVRKEAIARADRLSPRRR